LVLISGIPRILGAFLLPNAFGDAYVYIRDIGTLSTKMTAGSFALTDLFGFWLPLYQFLAAIVNLFVHNGFYAGKLVSATFGIGLCLLVYLITLQLTSNRLVAWLGFLLIALNPLHIFYSASAMTDIPHACFVLASLYFVLRRRWVLASVCAALAGFTRVESWMFLAIIPALQLLKERRLSIPPIVILLMPPVFWFYLSWKATGDWLACFKQRQSYLHWLLAMNPSLARFSTWNVLRDIANLLISNDVAVLIACLIVGVIIVRNLPRLLSGRDRQGHLDSVLPSATYFFAFFGLLTVAYLKHQQPIIFPRYGLILFCLGIPILAWTLWTIKNNNYRWAKRIFIMVVVVCALNGVIEFAGVFGTVNQISAQRVVADYLRDHFDPESTGTIFSDEGTVTVMSGILPGKFVTSSEAPVDREGFLNYLKEKNVTYLVYVARVDVTPAKLWPELIDTRGNEAFMPIMRARSMFLPADIVVFQLK
jgi:hypothetical protein